MDKVLRRDCVVDDYPNNPGIYSVTAWITFFNNMQLGIRILNNDEGENIRGNYMHEYRFINLIFKHNSKSKEDFYSAVCRNLDSSILLKGTFEHELTHYITRLDKNIQRSGYKRAKDKGTKSYIKHPQELPSQIMGMISDLDIFVNELSNPISILQNEKLFYEKVAEYAEHQTMFPHAGVMRNFRNPSFFDKLVSFIKPIGELFRTDSNAKEKLLKALNQYRIGKLKELKGES